MDELLNKRCDSIAITTLQAMQRRQFQPTFFLGRGTQLYLLTDKSFDYAMDDGDRKAVLFAALRHLVHADHYDSFFAVTDAWFLEPNARLMALPDSEMHRLSNYGTKKLVELGYGTRYEAVLVAGQTPTRVHTVQLRYERKGISQAPNIVSVTCNDHKGATGPLIMWSELEGVDAELYEQMRHYAPSVIFRMMGIDLDKALVET